MIRYSWRNNKTNKTFSQVSRDVCPDRYCGPTSDQISHHHHHHRHHHTLWNATHLQPEEARASGRLVLMGHWFSRSLCATKCIYMLHNTRPDAPDNDDDDDNIRTATGQNRYHLGARSVRTYARSKPYHPRGPRFQTHTHAHTHTQAHTHPNAVDRGFVGRERAESQMRVDWFKPLLTHICKTRHENMTISRYPRMRNVAPF